MQKGFFVIRILIGIYKITNKINGKVYVGQSRNILRRWNQHKNHYLNVKARDYHLILCKALRKYGIDNFNFKIIEQCELEKLNEREMFWIDKLKSNQSNYGYNVTNGGLQGYHLRLNQDNVTNIQKQLISGKRQVDIAKQFNVSQRTISDINMGATWFNQTLIYPLNKRVSNNNKKNHCCVCGVRISSYSSFCPICAQMRLRKCIRPNRNELKSLIRNQSFLSIGKKYGVSGNSICKWCKQYNLPSTKKVILSLSDEDWQKV